MRRFLVVTILLLPIALPNPTARMQQRVSGLPKASDYPPAGPNCKRRVKLEPWVGTPEVGVSDTYNCVLDIHMCDGVKTYISEARRSASDMCADYRRARDELLNTEICCDPKCEKGTPWFNPSPDCRDVRTPEVSVSYGQANVRICGYSVFDYRPSSYKGIDFNADAAYRRALIDFIKSRIGSKVCCDGFRDSGCHLLYDLDCDGKPNETDTTSLNPSMPNSLPDINIFNQSGSSAIDPFPPGLDANDPNFFPPGDKCDCKWELTKGTLTCSSDGKQSHVYQARWRCPSSGNERFTRKEAPATASCTPPRRAGL